MREVINRKAAREKGLKHYYTGKLCRRGHDDIRYSNSGSCKSCRLEDLKRHRKNPEYRAMGRASSDRWKERNAEKLIQQRKDRWANDEVFRASCKRYFEENYEKILASYRVENMSPERANQFRAMRASYSIRRRNAEGRFNKDDIEAILIKQDYKCENCKKCLLNGYHIDHIMPIKLGGSHWPKNLQCLCAKCNLAKRDLHPDEWLKREGRL